MAEVQQDVRRWLHRQQDWLQAAAAKLLSSGNLTDADIQYLVDQLKSGEDRRATSHRTFVELGAPPLSQDELRLVEIGEIQGIENLAPRSPLTFGSGNLSVIYGHNGSGKSGYTRILKRACGKPRAKDLNQNVFQPPPPTQQCRITYRLAGTDHSEVWKANSEPIEDIRAIDLFDVETATLYLSEETEASYTPPSVTLFGQLAKVCDRIKAKLLQEQNLLVNALPALPSGYASTAAGIEYRKLKPDTDESTIQCLVIWTEGDTALLTQLEERLKTSDPATLARQKRTTKSQLDQLVAQLKEASAAVGHKRFKRIRGARKEARAKRRIASEIGQVTPAQFGGIGSASWNALWEAARQYSQTAYPGLDFPVTDDEARCVLCHQELARDAQRRLREFEKFVQGTVETTAETAEEVYKQELTSLPAIPTAREVRTQCEAAGLTEEDWAKALEDFWSKVGSAREWLLKDEAEEEALAVESPGGLLKELVQRSAGLARDAVQYEKDALSFDRTQAELDKLNLEARRWTAQQAAAIRTEIARLKKVTAYEKWKQAVNSREISVKGGKIAKQVITEAYVRRFSQELKAIGASRVKVELSVARTKKGTVLHSLRLRGVRKKAHSPESILSEGERRIVSLAAFLADVAEKQQATPFIFDDPISSLDLDFERQVATRLVDLAQDRQVVVFTHRLSLYGALSDEAQKIGNRWAAKNLRKNYIESFGGTSGHPDNGAVWAAESTLKALQELLRRLDRAQRVGEEDGAQAYRELAQGICTDFRKLLERSVEEDLLNKVVLRHRQSVTTRHRLEKLQHINSKDCKFFDRLMTKYSCYEHSQSQETPVFLPEEPELREDLESLKRWQESFNKRPAAANP